MAATDILRPFTKVQPTNNMAVNAREFVDSQSRLEQSLNSLLQFCRTVVPTGSIIPAKLSADDIAGYFDSTGLGIRGRSWENWALCNGNNGTPSLDGKFPRFETSAAGGTGGSDSSAHTHSTPAHYHVNEFGFDGTNWFGKMDGSGNPASGSTVESSVTGINPAHGDTSATINLRLAHTRTDGSGTSGAASVSDNKPAYYELVPVMRI